MIFALFVSLFDKCLVKTIRKLWKHKGTRIVRHESSATRVFVQLPVQACNKYNLKTPHQMGNPPVPDVLRQVVIISLGLIQYKESYQYGKSHCGDKTILRPSYLYNGISYTCKMSLYWTRALVAICTGYSCPTQQHIIQQRYWCAIGTHHNTMVTWNKNTLFFSKHCVFATQVIQYRPLKAVTIYCWHLELNIFINFQLKWYHFHWGKGAFRILLANYTCI